MFKTGDIIVWKTKNGKQSGRVICHDTFGLGYMIVALSNNQRMLVHESSASLKTDTTVANYHR